MLIICKGFEFNNLAWLHGEGGFVWNKMNWINQPTGEHLYLMIPKSKDNPDIPQQEMISIRVKKGKHGTDEYGSYHGWDGNYEQPSIDGSIQAGEFHGWLLQGVLSDNLNELKKHLQLA